MSRRSEAVDGWRERAGALIARAWRARAEALRSPAADEATLGDVMARVEADLARACEICKEAGGRKEHSVALGKLGHVALDLGDPERARTLFAESVAVARETGDPLRVAHALRHLGQVNRRLGRVEVAERCYEEALGLYEGAGTVHPVEHANALRPMAALREERGDVEEARVLWRRAMEMYRAAGVEEGVGECEGRLAGCRTPVRLDQRRNSLTTSSGQQSCPRPGS